MRNPGDIMVREDGGEDTIGVIACIAESLPMQDQLIYTCGRKRKKGMKKATWDAYWRTSVR